MTHSLSESGLNFPHVLTNRFVPPVANDRQMLRHEHVNENDHKTVRFTTDKEVVWMRQEIPEIPPDKRRVDSNRTCLTSVMQEPTLGQSASQPELSHATAQAPIRTTTSSRVEPMDWVDSPFACKASHTRQKPKLKRKPKEKYRRQREKEQKEEDEEGLEEQQEEQALDMNMDKLKHSIDRRTLAILERSKKLLMETKYPKKKYHLEDTMPLKRTQERPVRSSTKMPAGIQDQPHQIDESRDNEANLTKSPPVESQNAQKVQKNEQSREDHANPDVTFEGASSIEQQEQAKLDTPMLQQVIQDLPVDPSESRTGSEPDAITARAPDKQLIEQVHEQVNSMELLQPPKHDPLNENEWENELARQILTIYASSVRAKVLQNGGTQPDPQLANSPNKARPNTSNSKGSAKLPSIYQKSGGGGPRRATNAMVGALRSHGLSSHSPTNRSVNYSWEPSHQAENGKVVINVPKLPNPIWFAGTGAVKAVWCAIALSFLSLKSSEEGSRKPRVNPDTSSMCSHRICEELRTMEANKKYSKYVATVESLIVTLVRSVGIDELVVKLWKQLVVTCNAFASRCIDYKRFPVALGLMKQAEDLIQNSVLVPTDELRMELMAFVYDTYGYYYYKRQKPHAGLQYIHKAQEIHARQENWSHIAKCRLHLANMQNLLGQHHEAFESLVSILQMIDEDKLEEQQDLPEDAKYAFTSSSAQKICLAAICYNNMAIEQLHHKDFEAAHTSSTNAKRLAKLCLSYSNRWLSQFETTSKCVSLAIATLMENANQDKALELQQHGIQAEQYI